MLSPQYGNYEMKDELTNFIMMISLQYTYQNYHIIHLKLTQGYMSIITQ